MSPSPAKPTAPATGAACAPKGFKTSLEARLTAVWYSGAKAGWLGLPLDLLSGVYSLLRQFSQQDQKSKAARQAPQPPVLVIGNLIAGGAGKTPVVMAVCNWATQKGLQIGIVSRGYGQDTGAVRVGRPELGMAQAHELGDEPAWLIRQTGCPIAVGADRQAALQALLAQYPKLALVVSDDGLQHHRLPRTQEWVVFDERFAGNHKLLPAGPLREPLTRLHTVDAVLASNCMPMDLLSSLPPSLKPESLQGKTHAVQVRPQRVNNPATGESLSLSEALERWKGQSICAFAGLGNPDKFFKAMRACGFELQETLPLPDHFDYPASFCQSLSHPVLLTTGKDAVKLPDHEARLWVVDVAIELPPALCGALETLIGRAFD